MCRGHAMSPGRGFGWNHSEETKRRIGKGNTGKVRDKLLRSIMATNTTLNWQDPEYRQKVLEGQARYLSSEAGRMRKPTRGMLGHRHSEETKALMALRRSKGGLDRYVIGPIPEGFDTPCWIWQGQVRRTQMDTVLFRQLLMEKRSL